MSESQGYCEDLRREQWQLFAKRLLNKRWLLLKPEKKAKASQRLVQGSRHQKQTPEVKMNVEAWPTRSWDLPVIWKYSKNKGTKVVIWGFLWFQTHCARLPWSRFRGADEWPFLLFFLLSGPGSTDVAGDTWNSHKLEPHGHTVAYRCWGECLTEVGGAFHSLQGTSTI